MNERDPCSANHCIVMSDLPLLRAAEIIITATAAHRAAAATKKPVSLLVLTGAGMSTAAGLPDYRSPGTGLYTRGHRPITIQQFVNPADKQCYQRRRYWARSAVGYSAMDRAAPAESHYAVAKLMQQLPRYGAVTLSQNVDGLHHRAMRREFSLAGLAPRQHAAMLSSSSSLLLLDEDDPNDEYFQKSDPRVEDHITELHGSIHFAVCMSCGQREHRRHLQRRIEALNGEWLERVHRRKDDGELEPKPAAPGSKHDDDDEFTEKKSAHKSDSNATIEARPDGDALLTGDDVIMSFRVPPCSHCGEPFGLRPHVVLFGDFIPTATKQRAEELSQHADVLLVAGTSLQVPSAFTFVRSALARRLPIVLFGDGETRLDTDPKLKGNADVHALVHRVEGRLEKTLPALVDLLETHA